MSLSKFISGILIMVFGGTLIYFNNIIFGTVCIILGWIILFNRKEDKIEKIKYSN